MIVIEVVADAAGFRCWRERQRSEAVAVSAGIWMLGESGGQSVAVFAGNRHLEGRVLRGLQVAANPGLVELIRVQVRERVQRLPFLPEIEFAAQGA